MTSRPPTVTLSPNAIFAPQEGADAVRLSSGLTIS